MSVDGDDQGLFVGVRAPDSDSPVINAGNDSIACNTRIRVPVSSTVIDVPAGVQLGTGWGHGAPSDPEGPLAKDHKGNDYTFSSLL